MYISSFKMRAKSPDAAAEICRLFRQTLPMKVEPGYLRGACTVNTVDRSDVLIAELWGNRQAFQAWQDSPARTRLTEQLAPLVDGPVELTLYEEV